MVPQPQMVSDPSPDRPQATLEAEPPPGLPRVSRLCRDKRAAPAGLQTGQRTSWGHVTTAGPHLRCAQNHVRLSRTPSRLLRVHRTGTAGSLSRTMGQDLSRAYHDDMTTWSRGTALGAEHQHSSGIRHGNPWNSPGRHRATAAAPRVLGGIGTHTLQDTSGMQDKLRNRPGCSSGSHFRPES